MATEMPDLAAVVARLEKVERQNRRLKIAGVTALVLAAAGLLMGQALPAPRTVEAEVFVVRDANGQIRSRLSEIGLELLEQNGKVRVHVGLLPIGWAGLSLSDAAGTPRATLALSSDGSPSLDLFDRDANPRATVGTTPPTQMTPVGPSEKRPESSVVLFDKDRAILFKAP